MTQQALSVINELDSATVYPTGSKKWRRGGEHQCPCPYELAFWWNSEATNQYIRNFQAATTTEGKHKGQGRECAEKRSHWGGDIDQRLRAKAPWMV